MSSIQFVSHESFPEDQYTQELVYLCLEGKYRVAYVRKASKNGGKFWSIPTIGIQKDGAKAYYESFLQDSTFLDKDIKNFLDKREWETKITLKEPVVTDWKPAGPATCDQGEIPF